MIFRTFDNDLTGLINKIGIFNKSFKTIGRDLSTGHGLLTSLFSGKNVTQKDIQSINAMNQAMKNGSTMAQAWYDNMRGYTVAAKEQAKQCLSNKGNLDELSNGLKNVTVDSKLAEIGLTALRTAGNMFLAWGITKVIEIFDNLATSTDRLKESAEELGSALSSTRSDFEDYKNRIGELQDVIKSDSSSYQETYDARQQLLGIQDELIEKYGDEAETIRLVTEAINGNNEALDKLSQNKAKEILKDFNEGTGKKWTERFADSMANFFSGSKNNVDRMVNQMEDTKISFRIEPVYDQDLNKLYADFQKKAKEIFDVQVESTDIGNTFTVSGDLDEIYNKLQNIKSLAKDMGIENSSFFTDLDKQIDKAKDSLDSYGEAYNQYILSTKIFENDDYTNAFNKIREEYKKYQEAFASGDDKVIEKAKKSFAEVVHGATEGITDDSVVDFFEQMYPDLQAVVKGWEFELHFKAAIEDDKDDFENNVKQYVSEFRTSDDIRNYNDKLATDEQRTAYYELLDLADEYKISLDDLIAKLEQLGLIAPQVDADIRDSIRSISDNHGISDRNEYDQLIAYTANFTEEEKKLWLESTKGAKNATEAIQMYEAALAKAKQEANETGISPLSISQTIDQLNTQLKPAFDSLKSAYQDIFTDDGFTLENVDLSMLDSIKSSIDELNKMEGVDINIDYSSFENLAKVLTN